MNSKLKIERTKVIEHFQLSSLASDDLLLRKIHLGRLRETLPDFCTTYLLETFLATKDVRFFNEYLWLIGSGEISERASDFFYNNLDDSGHYTYCYDKNLKYCLSLDSDLVQVRKEDFNGKSVALIGSPFHFFYAFKALKRLGVCVDVLNIKYHPNKILKPILNNFLVSLGYRWYFGRANYFEINIANKRCLNNIRTPKTYDIGFHKLGFIIHQNLIDQFSVGLINDHWGGLPLFKGRSTLEYSKLFGANLIVTNHLISPKIDSGSILCYTLLSDNRLKRDIYLGIGKRIVKSLSLLASGSIKPVDNSIGKMFYEMHPWLMAHVVKIIKKGKFK